MKINKSNIKKNYFEFTECLLNTLPISIKRVEELKTQIRWLSESCIKSIDYSNERVQTSNLSNQTEETALINIQSKKRVLKLIAEEEIMIFRYQKAIDTLEDKHRAILMWRYFKGLEWPEVSDKISYSRKQCMRLRDEAVSTLAFYFYGQRALKDEIMIDLLREELC